jgi:hypothetical protein
MATESTRGGAAAGLSVFRVGEDGKLSFVRKYDVDVGDKTMFWAWCRSKSSSAPRGTSSGR